MMVVILPCKAHFFHEVCIASWMEKSNACPVCRFDVTVGSLKGQQRELTALMKTIKKETKK